MPALFKTKRNPADGLLTPGVYKFVVESSKEVTTTEFPYAALQIKAIVGGVKQDGLVFETMSTSPKSRFRVVDFFNSVGAPNEEGEVGADWFRGKVGWARFYHQENDDGKLQVKVKSFLTEAEAERAIQRDMEQRQEDAGAMVVQTRRSSSRPAPEPEVVKKGKKTTVVDEHGDDEDIPF